MTLKFNFAFLICVTGFCLTACATSTSKADVTSAETPDAEKPMFEINYVRGEVICKDQKVLGTGFTRELCATQKEWDDYAADTRAENRKKLF